MPRLWAQRLTSLDCRASGGFKASGLGHRRLGVISFWAVDGLHGAGASVALQRLRIQSLSQQACPVTAEFSGLCTDHPGM